MDNLTNEEVINDYRATFNLEEEIKKATAEYLEKMKNSPGRLEICPVCGSKYCYNVYCMNVDRIDREYTELGRKGMNVNTSD